MTSHPLDFRLLKARVSLEHVLRDRGLLSHMKPRGADLVGPCPIHHGDSSVAFVASRTKNLWYCFTRCQEGGDVIDLVRRLDDSDYHQAARYLATLAGPSLLPPPQASATFRPFTSVLPLDPSAAFLHDKGIHARTARDFDAGAYHGRGFLQGCVAVRLHDPVGAPLGYAGRILDPERARCYGKWKFPPRFPKSTTLFNYHRVRSQLHRGLVVVEDPWSTMRLAQVDVPAVALLGTTASAEQLALLHDVPFLLLALDGDPAGRTATAALRAKLGHAPASVVSLDLPDGLDPDQLSDVEIATCWNLVTDSVK
jgi:DNA primase